MCISINRVIHLVDSPISTDDLFQLCAHDPSLYDLYLRLPFWDMVIRPGTSIDITDGTAFYTAPRDISEG